MTSVENAILARVRAMPALPGPITRLFVMLGDPNCSAIDVEDVIRPDAAMTTNVLRLINSAAFGIPRTVTSVRQAVALLGTKRVLESATSMSMLRFVPAKLPGYGISAAQYWNHCAATAVLTELLVTELNVPDHDLAFTAGLLHDVGKLAIATYLLQTPAPSGIRFDKPVETFLEAEEAMLGTCHTRIGAMLGIRWNLPEPLVWVIRWHHDPASAGEAAPQALLDAVHVGDNLAHMLGYGADAGELSRNSSRDTLSSLQITTRILERVAYEAVPRIRALCDVLSNKVG